MQALYFDKFVTTKIRGKTLAAELAVPRGSADRQTWRVSPSIAPWSREEPGICDGGVLIRRIIGGVLV
jgi:hypothetical protein